MGTVVSKEKQQLKMQRKNEILKSIQERNQGKVGNVQQAVSEQENEKDDVIVKSAVESQQTDGSKELRMPEPDTEQAAKLEDIAESDGVDNLSEEAQSNESSDNQVEEPSDGTAPSDSEADERISDNAEDAVAEDVAANMAEAPQQETNEKQEVEAVEDEQANPKQDNEPMNVETAKDSEPESSQANKEAVITDDKQANESIPTFIAYAKYGKEANPHIQYLDRDEILPPGTIIKHNGSTYEVIDKMGAGSFAITYLMRDGEGNLCVMKEFHPDRTLRYADYTLDYSRCIPAKKANVEQDEEYEKAFNRFKKLKEKFEKEPERVRGFLKRGKKEARNINDSMSYSEAFNSARREVGAGGSFKWKGEYYSTYTDDEKINLNISIPKTDCFRIGEGLYFLMKNIEGKTLTDFMHKGKTIMDESPMTFELAMQIMKQLCEAVKTIHQIPCAHMDINPNNIMVLIDEAEGANGKSKQVLNKLKIIDFGMATYAKGITLEMAEDALQKQVDGSYVPGGTKGFSDAIHRGFDYVSPNDAMKIEDKLLLIDVYALGSILYYLLLLDYNYSWNNTQDRLESELRRMSHHNDDNLITRFKVREGDSMVEIRRKRKYMACYELVRKATEEDFQKRIRTVDDFLKEILQIQADINWDDRGSGKSENKEITVTPAGGEIELAFRHNYKCCVQMPKEYSWLHPNTSLIKVSDDNKQQLLSQRIPGKVKLKIEPNDNTKQRMASVTIICGKQRINATIVQEGIKPVQPDIIIPNGTVSLSKVDFRGGEGQAKFTATSAWTSVVEPRTADWLHLSETEGQGGKKILTFRLNANPYNQERRATIKIQCGSKSKDWTVIQAPKPAASIEFIKGTRTQITVPASGDNRPFPFSCNEPWTAQIQPSDAETWIKFTKKGEAGVQSFNTVILRNGTNTPRTASISLWCGDKHIKCTVTQEKAVFVEPPKVTPDTGAEKTKESEETIKPEDTGNKPVTPQQKPKAVESDRIDFTERSQTSTLFKADGGQGVVKFQTTSGWTAEIVSNDSSWLTLSDNKGIGNLPQTLRVTAKPNAANIEREATLRIRCGTAYKDWPLKQEKQVVIAGTSGGQKPVGDEQKTKVKKENGPKKDFKGYVIGSLAAVMAAVAAFFINDGGGGSEGTAPAGPLAFTKGQKVELSYKGGNIAVPVESPGLWKVEIAEQKPEGWLQIQEGSGKAGKHTFGLKAGVNRKYEPRKATLVLTSGDDRVTAKVTQGIDRADSLNNAIVKTINNPVDIIKFLGHTKKVVTVYECFEEGGKKYTDGVPDLNTILTKKDTNYIIGTTHDVIEFTQDDKGKIDTIVLLKR